jgi:hypothetical protein
MALHAYACWICGKLIDLTNCKTDEHGLPVHGDCYVLRTLLKSRGEPMASKVSPPNQGGPA